MQTYSRSIGASQTGTPMPLQDLTVNQNITLFMPPF